jgi:hypothetical protein
MSESETLLNTLLTGRSDTFKAKVLEIVYRHHLDPNDPNFQILIATGQLEVLLEEAPGQFEAVVSRLLEMLRRSMDAEVKLIQQLIQSERDVLLGAKQLTQEYDLAFEQKLKDIQAAIADHQSTQQKLIEEQKAQRETVIQEYKAVLAKEAKELIQLSALELRGSWAMRVALPSAIAFLSLASIGFIGGWSAKSAQIYQQYSPAELEFLGQIWQGNSDRLIQCQRQKKNLCQVQLSSTR